MKKTMYLIVAASLTLSAGYAFSQSQYVEVECMATDGESLNTTYEGYLVIEDDDLNFSDGGFSVFGQEVELETVLVENNQCRTWYMRGEFANWDGRIHYYQTERDFNALKVKTSNSSIYVACDRGSILRVFAEQADLLEDVYVENNRERSYISVSDRTCILNGF